MENERKDPWMGEIKVDAEKASESGTKSSTKDNNWEKDIIERLSFAALKEQRRSRRWGIFFKLLTFAYLLAIFIVYLPGDWSDQVMHEGKHTALVEIQGVIADNSEANADNIISGLRSAFESKATSGVILRINSPGGSPVQAGYVNDEIVRLREKYPDIRLYTVITDICASGGYYIAAAADEIYADKASIVGSIGVLMDGFGFVDMMEKLGIERRLMTAGESKGFLDPFSPVKEEDQLHIKNMLTEIHQQFIHVVKEGRGARLKEDEKLFSGLVWTGEQSIDLGLVDALGSSSYVAREIIGAEKIVDFTHRPPTFERFIERFGVAMANVLTSLSSEHLR